MGLGYFSVDWINCDVFLNVVMLMNKVNGVVFPNTGLHPYISETDQPT